MRVVSGRLGLPEGVTEGLLGGVRQAPRAATRTPAARTARSGARWTAASRPSAPSSCCAWRCPRTARERSASSTWRVTSPARSCARAAAHLRDGQPRRPMKGGPDARGVLTELSMRGRRETAQPATLEVERLQLEFARIDRTIQAARAAGAPGMSVIWRIAGDRCEREFDGAYERAPDADGRHQMPIMLVDALRRPARSGVAQLAEHSAVNRRVVGSSPTPRASTETRGHGGTDRPWTPRPTSSRARERISRLRECLLDGASRSRAPARSSVRRQPHSHARPRKTHCILVHVSPRGARDDGAAAGERPRQGAVAGVADHHVAVRASCARSEASQRPRIGGEGRRGGQRAAVPGHEDAHGSVGEPLHRRSQQPWLDPGRSRAPRARSGPSPGGSGHPRRGGSHMSGPIDMDVCGGHVRGYSSCGKLATSASWRLVPRGRGGAPATRAASRVAFSSTRPSSRPCSMRGSQHDATKPAPALSGAGARRSNKGSRSVWGE